MAGTPHLHRRSGTRGGLACPELGLRRVTWVLIVTDDHGPRCQVVGLGHRLPVRRMVPLGVAVALIAAGVPYALRTAPAPAASTTGHVAARHGERV